MNCGLAFAAVRLRPSAAKWLLLLWLWLQSVDAEVAAEQTTPLLLLVSFDGLRYDFVNATSMPNLWRIKQLGVHLSAGVRPQFPTITAPNHMSMVTGLYPAAHGIVGNNFYASETQYPLFDVFDFWNNRTRARASLTDWHWYANAEPIWVTNQKHHPENRRSGSMRWPMGNGNFSGQYVTKHTEIGYEDYGTVQNWTSDVDTMLQWFSGLNPINLGVFYITFPDEVLHHDGYPSRSFSRTLADLDEVVKHMFDRIQDSGLSSRLNVIFAADHGHSSYEFPARLFCVNWYAKELTRRRVTDLMVYKDSEDDSLDELYAKLKRIATNTTAFKVYRKAELPPSWHSRQSSRMGELIMVKSIGWDAHATCADDRATLLAKPRSVKSTHGYPPEEEAMRASLILWGPSFRRNHTIDERNVQIVDLYPLMCQLLGIEARPHNGSLAVLARAIRSATAAPQRFTTTTAAPSWWQNSWKFSVLQQKIPLIVGVCAATPLLFLFVYLVFCLFSLGSRTSARGGGMWRRSWRSSSTGYRKLQLESNAEMDMSQLAGGGNGVGRLLNVGSSRGVAVPSQTPLISLATNNQDEGTMSEDEL